MRIEIDIPKEFEKHFNQDKFKYSFDNFLKAYNSELLRVANQVDISYAYDDISREAKQGKWILDEFTAKYGNPYRCSCCNIEFGDTYNYCPNCGASMNEAK